MRLEIFFYPLKTGVYSAAAGPFDRNGAHLGQGLSLSEVGATYFSGFKVEQPPGLQAHCVHHD